MKIPHGLRFPYTNSLYSKVEQPLKKIDITFSIKAFSVLLEDLLRIISVTPHLT
jgi:hypothetical protein